MERFVDGIIIFLFTVFVGHEILADKYLIVVIYGVLSFTFFEYFLLYNTKEKKDLKPQGIMEVSAFALQMLAVILALINKDFIVLIPIALYNSLILKNYIGLVIALIAYLGYVYGGENVINSLYILLLIIVASYMFYKTETLDKLRKNVKALRDESVIKEDELESKNMSLIQAKDDEIYFTTIKERNRIAREIHDNVGHMLTRAILQLGALIVVCKDESLKAGLEALKKTLDTAMNNIRNSVHDLRDEAIDLPTAIEDIVKPLRDDRKLSLDIDISSDVRKDVKYAIIGVVKEAVSNIIKHSDNAYVDITLNEHPSMYQLVVHDYDADKSIEDGKETKQEPDKSGKDLTGMGLDNIRTRVSSVGGNVLITDDNGFRIFVTIAK
ncbi:MAG: hypothetical protein K5656_08595 [Lachnospiraceae bacterium]|nr:hypothetical protein [Lachnospiraceae bacterium]